MFTMNINDIRRNLEKFFQGEETKEGNHLINRWYHYFDDQPNRLNEYSDEAKDNLRRSLLENINESISTSQKNRPLKSYTHQRNKPLSRRAKLTAGFIIVLLASLPVLYYQSILFTSQNQENAAHRMVSNPAGQSSKVSLADESTIWLSAASTLRYPKKFADSLRTVTLKGEAFFDVAPDPNKPFIVNSGELRTRVLGTSFNIRGFDNEQEIQITVATGRVAVEQKTTSKDRNNSADSIALLAPDQQLVFNKETKTGATKKAVQTAQYTSWKEGKLIFDNHTFEEIAQRLEHWYGVQIHFADSSLKQIRFKITFDNNSLEHALKMLRVIEKFEFKMENNQVWISKTPS